MTCERKKTDTVIINYQNTSFYVHCWRLPKDVKQTVRTVSGPLKGSGKLLLEEKNGSGMCCGNICISYYNDC